MRAGTHPDVEWVSTEGMTITVDDVRAVIRSAAKMPTVARWRVVVVEDADRLGDGAANALLKSVEEPPARTVFVLCAPSTDPHDIAVTLRSRCRHLYVPTPSPAEVERALLADTPVVVLDEATAAADPDSEWAIRQGLSRLLEGRTVLMIAHRLHTVRDADRIVVLDRGRVVESGTHDDLLAADGLYAGLWRATTPAVPTAHPTEETR